jgi:hypothetical protein
MERRPPTFFERHGGTIVPLVLIAIIALMVLADTLGGK